MEDWEQFFVEKSIRRRGEVRRRERAQRFKLALTAIVMLGAIAAYFYVAR
ncbi:MAG: hypothetical protein ABIO80_03015 [Sphingomicrobium sp.]